MAKLFDRVKVNVPTTGTGDIEFGAAVSTAFLTPVEAGALDGNEVRYVIVDGLDFEEGLGLIKDTVATMERTVTKSKIGGTVGTSKINLSGTAVLALTASAADILTQAMGLHADANLADVEDADEALDNLGGTAIGKTIFTAADADAARAAIGESPTERQNAALSQMRISKLMGAAVRYVKAWATGLKAATDADRGINTGASSNVDVSQSAASGYVKPTKSPGSYTTQISTTLAINDTGFSGHNIRILLPPGSGGVSGGALKIRLTPPTSGANSSIAAIYVGHPATAPIFNGDQVQVKFGGSASVTLTAGGSTVDSDSTIYNYDHTKPLLVSVYVTSGDLRRANSLGSQYELHVKQAASEVSNTTVSGYTLVSGSTEIVSMVQSAPLVSNAMTLTTLSQTTDNNVSNARVLIEYDNVDSPTLGTDLTAEVTCDNGANWSSATLSLVTAHGQGGRSVVETADTACTAGTSFAARLKTANGKNVPIHGVSVAVH